MSKLHFQFQTSNSKAKLPHSVKWFAACQALFVTICPQPVFAQFITPYHSWTAKHKLACLSSVCSFKVAKHTAMFVVICFKLSVATHTSLLRNICYLLVSYFQDPAEARIPQNQKLGHPLKKYKCLEYGKGRTSENIHICVVAQAFHPLTHQPLEVSRVVSIAASPLSQWHL